VTYRLERGEPLDAGLRRIAREEVERVIASLRDDADIQEGVHDARERLKRVRAVLRLLRDGLAEDGYAPEHAFYRDLGRDLSELRDAGVAIDTLEGLRPHAPAAAGPAFPEVRDRLSTRLAETARRHLDEERRHERVTAALEGSVDGIAGWPIGSDRFETIAPGLRRVYRRGRRALASAYAGPGHEPLHEWRKRVKDLWYQVRILEGVWPPVMGGLSDSLHGISSALGDATDLSVLERRIREMDPPDAARRALLETLAARRAELRELAQPLGLRIWHESPGRFVRRVGAYWDAWRA